MSLHRQAGKTVVRMAKYIKWIFNNLPCFFVFERTLSRFPVKLSEKRVDNLAKVCILKLKFKQRRFAPLGAERLFSVLSACAGKWDQEEIR